MIPLDSRYSSCNNKPVSKVDFNLLIHHDRLNISPEYFFSIFCDTHPWLSTIESQCVNFKKEKKFETAKFHSTLK